MSLGDIPFRILPISTCEEEQIALFIFSVLKKLFAVSTAGSLHTDPRSFFSESLTAFAERIRPPGLPLRVASGHQPIPWFPPASKETRATWMAAAAACPSFPAQVSGSPSSCHRCLLLSLLFSVPSISHWAMAPREPL